MSRSFHTYRFSRSALIAAFYGAVAFASFAWILLQGHKHLRIAVVGMSPLDTLTHAISSGLLGAAAGLLLVILTRVLQERSSSVQFLHKQFHHLLASMKPAEIVLLALFSSIGEESLFRGALFDFIAGKMPGSWGTYLAILISSSLFTLLHIGPQKRFLSWTASSFAVGILLASLRVTTADLVAPIVAHFVMNLLNLADIVKRPKP